MKVCSTVKRKNLSFEMREAVHISPTKYYGAASKWKWALVEDSHGNIDHGTKRYKYEKIMDGSIPCEFPNRESALQSLQKEYEWWCNLHPTFNFLPFDRCVKEVEPDCTRANPGMHGLRLSMIPQ